MPRSRNDTVTAIEQAETANGWPPATWLPVHVGADAGQHFVAWADFGTAPLQEPFFADSARRALRHSAAQTRRMTLDDFLADSASLQSLTPDGFVFHMSRCGSTLVEQMLAAVPQHLVISEAAPLDSIVRLDGAGEALPGDRHVGLLRAMVAAFGRRRTGIEHHYVVKLDCWHTLALPLFRRAFPAVPWVFLYRDPVDVLVSHLRQPGAQMISDIVPPDLYGLDANDARPGADYYARVLNRICTAAADHQSQGRTLAIDYRDLPGAVFTTIMPHFGIAGSDAGCALMRLAAQRDAKSPHFSFTSDIEAKQREATRPLRDLAATHLGAVHRRLDLWAGHVA